MKKIFLFCFFISCFLTRAQVFDSLGRVNDSLRKVLNTPIETYLTTEVRSSSLTRIKPQNTPASVTSITAEDIANTPARNLYDLIETFVPGAIWASHYDGPHIGIRSAPSDRNYKYILLVNGINLNQKSLNGMSSELENWDLDDIEKIDIVRGPGSVTYGPGATMGVINITTKKATKTSINASARYIYPYDAYGANGNASYVAENFKVTGFASIMNLSGYEKADMFRVETNKSTNSYHYGYIGKGLQYINGVDMGNAPPLTYLKSELPQIKLHLGINFCKEWDLMVRYTTSDIIGQYGFSQIRPIHYVTVSESRSDASGEHYLGTVHYGNYADYGYVKHHVFSTAIKNTHSFGSKLELSTKLSFFSHDYEFAWNDYYYSNISSFDSIFKYSSAKTLTDPQNKASEMGRNWSENELTVIDLFNWTPFSHAKFALGGEISHSSIQKGWGDSKNEFIAGENWDFLSDENSYYILKNGVRLANYSIPAQKAIFVGNGFGITTYSTMAEANIQLTEKITFLLSGRTDKNKYIKWLSSPRAALVYELNDCNSIKLLAQRSQRMNTMGQLYLSKLSNTTSENESLTSFEGIYNYNSNKQIQFTVPIFYNIMDNIGLKRNSEEQAQISTSIIGRYKCWGVEPELRFEAKRLTIGLNHSFYVPISWHLYDESNKRNITSVGNWDYTTSSGLHLSSSSANSMCWSNQTTKFWCNFKFSKRVQFHVDARYYWAFEGGKDMLQMWINAAKGTTQEQSINQLIDELKSQNVYGADFRMNAGVSFKLSKSATLGISAMNIIGATGNRRYSLWEFWREYPSLSYTKEPLMISAKIKVGL